MSKSAAISRFGKLQGILSKMKVSPADNFYKKNAKFGNSGMFNYATNKQHSREELKRKDLETWNRFVQHDIDHSYIRLPMNGFQEMILLTEQGKLWQYPIDNEQGMEAEKQVPFEEHVFLDHLLKDFPKDESIQSFMGFVVAGLAKNHWMTVNRKHEIVKFYKEYFETKGISEQ